jgi:hypothetical protein
MTFEEWWNKHKDVVYREFVQTPTTQWGLALEVIAEQSWQAATKRAIGIARDTVATNYAWNDACYEIETAIRGENDKD